MKQIPSNIKIKYVYKYIHFIFVFFVTLLLLSTHIIPTITSNQHFPYPRASILSTEMQNQSTSNQNQQSIHDLDSSVLDIDFIYNITKSLSDIIFTEYDETSGEIAKGRAFGTKGEQKAAEIIFENMTGLGLYTTKEQLYQHPNCTFKNIIHKLEVINYRLEINNSPVDCYPAPSWTGSKTNHELNTTLTSSQALIKKRPEHPFLFNSSLAQETQPFFFFDNDQWNDPNGSLPLIDILKPYLEPLKFYMLFHIASLFRISYQTAFWSQNYPCCKGLILYDFNKDCHDMIYFGNGFKNYLPILFINGSLGKKIEKNIKTQTVDFILTQQYNTSIESYNVIGQLNGTDPSKSVIVSSLYDSWWCQGTADSAIGMGITLAIAKYFKDHDITPRYTIKFIAFCGEEYDIRGAKFYEAVHKEEEIIAVIDMNQIGFTQSFPRLTLDIVANSPLFLKQIWQIAEQTQYTKRTGNVADIKPIPWILGSIPSNSMPFGMNRKNCNAVSFFKDGGWILHHRDGLNHTKGDVMKYFNWTDTMVTGELILNITKFVSLDTITQSYPTSFQNIFQKATLERSYDLNHQRNNFRR